MATRLNKYVFLVFAIIMFATGGIFEFSLLNNTPEKNLIEKFRKKLNRNEELLISEMNKAGEILMYNKLNGNIDETFYNLLPPLDECGKAILIYKDEKLVFWTDRAVAFFDKLDNYETHNGIVQLRNGYYLITSIKTKEYDILGFLLIKNNYIYENKYLKNKFYRDYNIPDSYKLLQYEGNQSFPIYNCNGDLLFYMKPAGEFFCTKSQLLAPGLFYLLGLILLLFYLGKEFRESENNLYIKLIWLLTSLFVIYWFHVIFRIPRTFYHLRFFSSSDFAVGYWLPSLGDFFLIALFFLIWIYNFLENFNPAEILEKARIAPRFLVFLHMVFAALLYLSSNYFIEKLIFDSTISFSINQITSITVQTVLGLFAIGLFLMGIVSFTLKTSYEFRNYVSLAEELVFALLIILFIAVLQYITTGNINYEILILFFSTTLFASLFNKGYLRKYKLSFLIIFISSVSVYTLSVLYSNISEKERELQKLMSVTLVTERDPAAEVFLGEIQNQIIRDPKIPVFILNEERYKIPDYLEQTYFNGYFRKYNTKIYICSESDVLNVVDENRTAPCVPFFKNKFENNGIRITDTYFYYMDNMDGRISYAGSIYYPFLSDNSGIFIFVEMSSELMSEGIGFPELLIDQNLSKPAYYSKFSYAKYYQDKLADKKGDYNYNSYIDTYVRNNKEYQTIKRDGLEHLIYHTSQDNYILVSRKIFTLVDYLISFPYLFVFFILVALAVIFVARPSLVEWKFQVDLKFKIQMVIVLTVLFSLLVVAVVTIYTNVEGFKSKHREDLNGKMKSIAEDLDLRLENKMEIGSETADSLNLELHLLSDIFGTDINIFNPEGIKISSSRPEIFERGIISDRINTIARYQVEQNLSVYFQPEKLGKLSYLSAYRPIVNRYGDIIGIINLPYFIRQDNYRQEISTFVVAFINLYVLLLLGSIFVAVFISNQITRPLAEIQKNLKKIELGKPNEPIVYNRKDEIGNLVKEYNKKVGELAVSADLLARSERESAWREMAKQIAHEIKNPLTPMKLSIQYLQRAKDNTPEYKALVERVSSTLIEQIDNLSNIATEFSNFAQIPTARNQVFFLAEQLQKVIDLYETHDLAIIDFYPNGHEKIRVNADRDQFGRAIINLVKNAIQAMPDNQVGRIEISVNEKNGKAVIAVKDNGSGIPEELRDKLFTPSFTTKSSGMGLGLAIVKNIVENFSGSIWFETEINKGTTFYIEIPVYTES